MITSPAEKILVTGAAGFIGHKVCQRLLEQGYEVIGLDNFDMYYNTALKHRRVFDLMKFKGFYLEECSINSYAMDRIFDENYFSAVIHLAARAGVRHSEVIPDEFVMTNVNGTFCILQQMKRRGIKKIVFASSSSVYGDNKLPETGSHEGLPVDSIHSVYAMTKYMGERLVEKYCESNGIDHTILRFFTVYGPYGRPDMFVFKAIQAFLNERVLTVYGNGTQTRDFTYIDDIAEGVVKSLNYTTAKIINLGNTRPVSLTSIINCIEKMLSIEKNVEYVSKDSADVTTTKADIQVANLILGWEPQVRFNEGLRRTIQWHIDNQEWLLDAGF